MVPNSATFRSNRAAALALTAHEIEAENEYRTVLGTLQARQNELALSRARENRQTPAPEEKRSSIDGVEKNGADAMPKSDVKPPAIMETPQSAVAPELIEPPPHLESDDQPA